MTLELLRPGAQDLPQSLSVTRDLPKVEKWDPRTPPESLNVGPRDLFQTLKVRPT